MERGREGGRALERERERKGGRERKDERANISAFEPFNAGYSFITTNRVQVRVRNQQVKALAV